MIQVEEEGRQLIVAAGLMVATGIVQTSGMIHLDALQSHMRDWVVSRTTRVRMFTMISVIESHGTADVHLEHERDVERGLVDHREPAAIRTWRARADAARE